MCVPDFLPDAQGRCPPTQSSIPAPCNSARAWGRLWPTHRPLSDLFTPPRAESKCRNHPVLTPGPTVSRGALHASWDTHRKLLASSHLKDTSIWAQVRATMLFKPATSLPGSPCHKEVRGTRPGVGPSGFNSVPAHRQLCDVRKFRKASEPQSPLLSNGADDRTCLTGAAQPCGCFTLSQYLNSCLLRGWGGARGLEQPAPPPLAGQLAQLLQATPQGACM